MNQNENTQRLLGRILSQPMSEEQLAAVDAGGGSFPGEGSVTHGGNDMGLIGMPVN